MNTSNQRVMKPVLFFVSTLLLVGLACQTLLGDPEAEVAVEEIVIEPLPAEVIDEAETGQEDPVDASQDEELEAGSNDGEEVEVPADGENQESEETEIQNAPVPAEEGDALVLGTVGFVQDLEFAEVAYAFHIENPNQDFAVQDSDYQVAVYDSDGTVLETDSGFISLVLPGEQTAVSGSVWLDEGLEAAEIEVQLKSGEPVELQNYPRVSISNPRYFDEEFSQRATGIVESSYDDYLEDIVVAVVAYDSEGDIVGSGYTYVDWIDAGERTGVETYLTVVGNVDRIEMYPRTSYFSLDPAYGTLPDGAMELVIDQFGHVQDENEVVFGFVVSNPNVDLAIQNGNYSATAYSADGTVLFVDRGYLDLIAPGGKMFAGRFIYQDIPEEIDFIDYRLREGDFIESDSIPELTTENVAYLADDFSPTVTGEVLNPFDWDLEDVRVWAVLYDSSDNIIGNGYDYLEFIPANGKAAAEIYVDGLVDPARVELIAAVSYYEDVLGPGE